MGIRDQSRFGGLKGRHGGWPLNPDHAVVFPVKIVHDNYPCSPDLRGQCCHDKTKLLGMAVQHLRCWPLDRLVSEEGIPLQVPSPDFPSQHLQTTIKGVVGIQINYLTQRNNWRNPWFCTCWELFPPKIGPPRPSPLERSYLDFQIRSRLVFGGLGLLSPTECCEEDGLPDVARCYFHLSVHPGHEAASTTQLLTPTPPSPA